MRVLVLSGSLRESSANTAIARAAVELLPPGGAVSFFDGLRELPHYDEDLDVEGALPPVAARLRAAIAEADAILAVTPEYNGSISSALKNAIDWASRPRGAAALAGKRVAVISAAASARAGLWAREDAVRILTVAGAEPLPETLGVALSEGGFVDGVFVNPEVRDSVSRLLGSLTAPKQGALKA